LNLIKVIYYGLRNSIHDRRFVTKLKEEYEVEEHYLEHDGPLQITDKNKSEILIYGPLNLPFKNKCSNEIKVIGICHAYEINERHVFPEKSEIVAQNLTKSNGIIVDCEHIYQVIAREFGFLGRIEKIPYGCDFSRFAQAKIFRTKKLNILVNRSWTDLHYNDLIIEALMKIDRDIINFSLTLIGAGDKKEVSLKKYQKFLGREGIFVFNEISQTELIRQMKENWVYVSASKSDGTSISLLEAMAIGMVVCVSDFPSNLEWVTSDSNGFTFKNQDVNSLIETLKRIDSISNEEFVSISQNAKNTVAVEGNWDYNGIKFIEFIKSM
jgi:glycosyltransferase involved in cell wall biosynthesis